MDICEEFERTLVLPGQIRSSDDEDDEGHYENNNGGHRQVRFGHI